LLSLLDLADDPVARRFRKGSTGRKEIAVMTNVAAKQNTPEMFGGKDPEEINRPREIEEETKAAWNTIKRGRERHVVRLGLRAVGMKRKHYLAPPSR